MLYQSWVKVCLCVWSTISMDLNVQPVLSAVACTVLNLMQRIDSSLQLDKESSDLYTFITPFGRFRFLVMPFGLKSAPEVYQKVMDNIFEDCPDIYSYFDDIMVYSKNMTDHYEKLKKVFQIARESGLKLNKDKDKIAVSELQYLGRTISPDGVSPEPKKVSAVTDFPVPTSKQELMRFLGMATYLMRFVPEFSQKTSILRDLLKKDTNWLWDSHHNEAFLRVKDLLQSTTVLKFFDKDKPIVLSVDASSFGIGGALLQKGQPVAYTSATLSEAQQDILKLKKIFLQLFMLVNIFIIMFLVNMLK
ncbi:Retrovirus-related Pol polyprotein from transposon 297 [Araneus ventricosus]|uniref:Retrovirus-related Pol polyprotein from transposon 297 n=1 Tax=Araneus ventricosus TaxID=182803 RepID=A0A4Y2VY88_ARAVE|nr:Retrovirus-related Pol polyprotein from transposon 297 [Araneus ventricosus]